jgi:hypothetical protein
MFPPEPEKERRQVFWQAATQQYE